MPVVTSATRYHCAIEAGSNRDPEGRGDSVLHFEHNLRF